MEQQRTEAWFEKRKGKVTGSNVGAILGFDPFRSKNDVLRAMVRAFHKADSEFTGNIATEYGTKFESFALADLELEIGKDIIETGFHVHENEWLGASPDGLINDDAVVEIKCPFGKRNSNDFKPLHLQPHYHAQMQIEMHCTGRKECYFYQWSSVGSSLEMLDYSPQWIETNLPKLEEFYVLYLSELSNDAHLEPLIATKEAVQLADKFRSAKNNLDEAKANLDAARKELIALADGKKSNISGLLVYPINKKGSISYAKVVKDNLPDLDLSEYMGNPSTSWGVK